MVAVDGARPYSRPVDRIFFVLGALTGFLTVAAGAFGAHALQSRLDARSMDVFQTAVRYQMLHAVALLAVALATTRWPGTALRVSGWAFVVGLVIFCGSLYALAFGAPRWFGAITPLGGVAFLVGWGALAAAAW
ncbi:MAG: DUF423 domain-containing protein [Polyangiales bacterium]